MRAGPSDKAVAAAVAECSRLLCDEVDGNDAAKDALAAAHDPALGLDRSVCLRDVVGSLDEMPGEWAHRGRAGAIDWLTMQLGEGP